MYCRWLKKCLLVSLLQIFVLQLVSGLQGHTHGQESAAEIALKREDDAKLIDGLRRRRLFDLAEIYCQKQLANLNLDPTSRSHLTVELLKSQTSKAVLAPVGQREVAWAQVAQSAKQFRETISNHPRRILVKVQLALSHITHGKLLRQEIAAEMADDSSREKALGELRIARKLLQELERDIDKAIPELRSRSQTEHDLKPEQLLTLKNNLRYQLAVCNLHQSQLFSDADRLNRMTALDNVAESLAQVERATSDDQPLWWNAKLGQMECFRLSGDTGAAKLLSDSLPTKEIPTSAQGPLVEQRIQLAMELGNEAFSRRVIKEFDELSATNAQLDLAMIEFAVTLSARALTDEQKKKWLDFASQSAKSIAIKRGGYWGRRADLVLIRAAGGSATGQPNTTNPMVKTNEPPRTGNSNSITNTALDQMIRVGEDAFRKNNLDDAIKAYKAATLKARELKDSNQALRLSMIVGQILETQSKPDEAASEFVKAAYANPKAEFASSSHLRGCWNLAKTFKSKSENKVTFREQLIEHLRIWPDNPSANQARMYLGSQYQTNRQWSSAIETFLQVRNDSDQLSNAVKAARSSSFKLLNELKQNQKSVFAETRKIVFALLDKQRTMQQADPLADEFALLAAELSLVFGDPTHVDGYRWNDLLKKISNSANGKNANSASAILVGVVGVEDLKTGQSLLQKLEGDVAAFETCERCLAALSETNSNQNLFRLRLSVVNKLLARSPTTNLYLKKASVLGQLDQHAESVEVLKGLEKQFPRNAGIQMALARALTEQVEGGDPSEALDKWRRLQGKLKSYTPYWFEAKFNVANLLIKSGKNKEASRLLKLLKEVGPGWSKSDLKDDFEALLETIE